MVLSDFHHAHPAILPKPYFSGLTVEKGGQGAGTVLRVRMNVIGVEREFRHRVSEPEPGRVLVEEDSEAGVKTTFTVDPLEGGERSRVTIATDSRPSPGIQGWIERLVNPVIIRRILREELRLLARYAIGDGRDEEG